MLDDHIHSALDRTQIFADYLHGVLAKTGATFKSSDFGQGATFSTKATKAGTITYVCTIHPGMTGTIVVKPA